MHIQFEQALRKAEADFALGPSGPLASFAGGGGGSCHSGCRAAARVGELRP